MKLSGWLTLAGFLATVVFGLLNLPAIQGPGPILVGFAFISLIFTVMMYRHTNAPPFLLKEKNYRVEVHDPDGDEATFRKEVQLIPLHAHLDQYTHRNITSDGEGLQEIRVDPEVEMMPPKVEAGDTHIPVRFPHTLSRFKKARTWIELDCRGALTRDSEGVILLVDEPTKKLTLDVFFHEDRTPTIARAIHKYSGTDEKLHSPEFLDDHLHLRWVHKAKPFMTLTNGEYYIRWRW